MKEKKDRPVIVADSWTRSTSIVYDNSYCLDGPRITDRLLGGNAARQGVETLLYYFSPGRRVDILLTVEDVLLALWGSKVLRLQSSREGHIYGDVSSPTSNYS